MRYYLGLGANLGPRATNLADAIDLLVRLVPVRLLRASSVYETDPVGITDQPPFLNMVVRVETHVPPPKLLHHALVIEVSMGRVRDVRWGPRAIDIDLLLYDGPPVSTPDLDLPHPRLAERQFVLVPLAEIAPDLILPDGRSAGDAADPADPSVRRAGSLEECVSREQEP